MRALQRTQRHPRTPRTPLAHTPRASPQRCEVTRPHATPRAFCTPGTCIFTLSFPVRRYEDYFFGLTADSDAKFKIVQGASSPLEGTMDRRGGEPTTITIKCDPNGSSGEFIANLAFILPEEKDFSKFYQIKCTSR